MPISQTMLRGAEIEAQTSMNGLLLGPRREPSRPLGQSQGDTPSRMCASCRAPAYASCGRRASTRPRRWGRAGKRPISMPCCLSRRTMAPAALLRLLKRIERRAGRRLGTRWGPRCLDYRHPGLRWQAHGLAAAAAARTRPADPAASRDAQAHVRARAAARDRPSLAAPGARRCRPHASRPARSCVAVAGIRQALDFAASACEKTGPIRARFGSWVPRASLLVPTSPRGIIAWRA